MRLNICEECWELGKWELVGVVSPEDVPCHVCGNNTGDGNRSVIVTESTEDIIGAIMAKQAGL